MGLTSAKCLSQARLDGKTAVITGCNTGIGKVTARDFYKRGAKVIMACRSTAKAKEAADDILNECQNVPNTGEIVTTELDLSSLKSVRSCAERLNKSERKINLLINNAGVMLCPETRTEDGFELQFATNHLGHYLFTLLLLPKLIKSAPSRIVTVSAVAHEAATIDFEDLNFEKRPYSAVRAYMQSKLANILFTKELTRRLADANISGVTTYSLHPGVIATDLQRHLDETYFRGASILAGFLKLFFKTPEQGAQTSIFCAVDEGLESESGHYYAECALKEPAKNAKNVEDAEKLWNVSWEMAGLDKNYNPFV